MLLLAILAAMQGWRAGHRRGYERGFTHGTEAANRETFNRVHSQLVWNAFEHSRSNYFVAEVWQMLDQAAQPRFGTNDAESLADWMNRHRPNLAGK